MGPAAGSLGACARPGAGNWVPVRPGASGNLGACAGPGWCCLFRRPKDLLLLVLRVTWMPRNARRCPQPQPFHGDAAHFFSARFPCVCLLFAFVCWFFFSFLPHPFPCRAMTLAEPGAHSQFELQVEGAMTLAEPLRSREASGKALPNKVAFHALTQSLTRMYVCMHVHV